MLNNIECWCECACYRMCAGIWGYAFVAVQGVCVSGGAHHVKADAL